MLPHLLRPFSSGRDAWCCRCARGVASLACAITARLTRTLCGESCRPRRVTSDESPRCVCPRFRCIRRQGTRAVRSEGFQHGFIRTFSYCGFGQHNFIPFSVQYRGHRPHIVRSTIINGRAVAPGQFFVPNLSTASTKRAWYLSLSVVQISVEQELVREKCSSDLLESDLLPVPSTPGRHLVEPGVLGTGSHGRSELTASPTECLRSIPSSCSIRQETRRRTEPEMN